MTVSRRRIRVASSAAAVVVMALSTFGWVAPASAAEADPKLSVRLTALSPTILKKGADITMRGVVTNNNDFTWDNVQAYLVIPRSPFTSRAQVDDAKTNSNSYTGERIIEIDSFDNVGDLDAGTSLPFAVEVPYEQLGITGADGVYPVGIQILGTGPDGLRSNDSLAQATTFLPLLHDPPTKLIPTSIAWPFMMPTYRQADGTYARVRDFVRAINDGGRLRNLLGLARSTPPDTGTVIIDPALLIAAEQVSRGTRIPKRVKVSDADKLGAESFVKELSSLARRDRCWVVGYDRPDLLSFSRNRDLAPPLRKTVETATSNALDSLDISCRNVSWPRSGSVSSQLLQDVRGPGDQPVIVADSNLDGWDRRDGSVVKFDTGSGPVPLLVDDALDESVPGADSVVTLRQRIASESALATLDRAIDPTSAADAIATVNPDWNPGPSWQEGRLNSVFAAPWVEAAGLDSLLTRPIGEFEGGIDTPGANKAIGRAQLQRAAKLQDTAALLSSILLDDEAVQSAATQDIAQSVSSRWRSNKDAAQKSVAGALKRALRPLERITIEGPPRVTLSSDVGSFPLTIRNDTGHPARVGVRIESSNPALTIPDVKPLTIAADERRTLTVKVEVGNQAGASVKASLMTVDMETFGQPAEFNVRSSALGAVIWVGFAVAGLLVAVAIIRRVGKRRRLEPADE